MFVLVHISALDIDYRWFDSQNIAPRYEFGYGLSYTTFSYSALSVKPIMNTNAASNSGPQPGGPLSLYSDAVTATFTVKNAGNYDGNEVAQLYLVCSVLP
jgi:beta-glucosidase